MLKFYLDYKNVKTKNPLIGIGLSDENLKNLKDRKPIFFNLKELNIPIDIDVLIMSGETEELMEKEVKQSIASNVEVTRK